MKLYMQVTKDEYSLPLVVEDSPKKLGEKLGLSGHTISNHLCRGSKAYVVVEVDEDED